MRIFAVQIIEKKYVMAFTVVGVFPSNENAKKTSQNLQDSGFQDQDFFIYVNGEKKKAQVKSFWSRIFDRDVTETLIDPSLTASVFAEDAEQLLKAREVLTENGAIKLYEFNELTKSEASSLDFLKRMIRIKTKNSMYNTPIYS